MREGLFDIHYNGCITRTKRITKTTARKAFNNGRTIFIQSSKIAPNSYAMPAWFTNADKYTQAPDNPKWFDQVVSNFEFYNCTYETGYYASYYMDARKDGI